MWRQLSLWLGIEPDSCAGLYYLFHDKWLLLGVGHGRKRAEHVLVGIYERPTSSLKVKIEKNIYSAIHNPLSEKKKSTIQLQSFTHASGKN